MRSMTLDQIAYLLNCKGFFSSQLVQGYCIDSRLLKSGELFFALKGERVEGHAYLQEVKQKGAIAAVVSKDYQGDIPGFCLLYVEDPLYALQELAKAALSQSSTRVVAITGSLGKTSTKEFIRILLSSKYQVAASPGNSNSQVGVPLAILNYSKGDEEILVLEMGMTAPGHIARLVEIATPEVAVMTNVALVHACNFHSLEEIARAKAEIFSREQTRLGVLCRDLSNFSEICQIGACSKLSFSGSSPHADYGIDSTEPYTVQAQLERLKVPLGPLPIPGKHNFHNLLAAIAVARYFEIEWEEIKRLIPTLTLPDRRLQWIRHGDILFLNDSYNAAELSVKAALESLPQPEGQGRKIAILGSMLELGKFSHDCHQRVGEFALNHVELMYCLGEECRPIYEVWKQAGRHVQFFQERADLVACLRSDLKASDIVLLKGSRAKELWKVLEEI
jgi:UDP-N-acetylmuramoyl-tripeptide--D-alanyl-D-alanine ligase